MKNSSYHTMDVKNVCENKLKIEFGKPKRSDHHQGWFYLDGSKSKRLTVAKGRKPIPRKTYSSMARQLGLTIKEFDDLLDCPLTLEGYLKIITGDQ
jgi:hypothetical protein